MRNLRLLAASALVLMLAACAQQAVQLTVPVPPGNYRSELARAERAQLPLNDDTKAWLKKYIEYGGVRDRIKPGKPALFIVTEQSPYGRLLKLLADPATKLTADDLLTRPTFREWFKGPVIRTVVDAREEEYLETGPPDLRPLAANDGNLIWIFYPDSQNRLTSLMVVNNPQPAKKRGSELMHGELLDALRAVANVRLVARRQADLGFPAENGLVIFLPDMHLVSAARRLHFKYGFNQEDLFVRVLGQITQLKRNASQPVEVIHIGDYLDFWREVKGAVADYGVVQQIERDHQAMAAALRSKDLDVDFLMGNHDYDFHNMAESGRRWARRYFLPADDPSLLIMHGDFFDAVEKVPEPIKRTLVRIAAPQATQYELGKLDDKMDELAKADHRASDYSQHLQLPEPAPVGQMMDGAGPAEGSDWNVKAGGKFVDEACALCEQTNRDNGTHLKTVVIGHTHYARIATRAMQGGSFTLIDCGAWIETCVDAAGTKADNAQITAIWDNDARIYQLG